MVHNREYTDFRWGKRPATQRCGKWWQGNYLVFCVKFSWNFVTRHANYWHKVNLNKLRKYVFVYISECHYSPVLKGTNGAQISNFVCAIHNRVFKTRSKCTCPNYGLVNILWKSMRYWWKIYVPWHPILQWLSQSILFKIVGYSYGWIGNETTSAVVLSVIACHHFDYVMHIVLTALWWNSHPPFSDLHWTFYI